MATPKRKLSTSWRARVRTRACGLRSTARLAAEHQELAIDEDGTPQPDGTEDQRCQAVIYRAVVDHANKAVKYTGRRTNPRQWLNGALIEAAWADIHEADVQLIELFTDDHLIGRIPEVLDTVRAYLPADDGRRVALEQWWKMFDPQGTCGQVWQCRAPGGTPPTKPTVDHQHRELISTALRAAYTRADNEHGRVRSFRNVLLGTAIAIMVLLVGIGVVGLVSPPSVSLCFTKIGQSSSPTASTPPAMLICPTGQRETPNGPSGSDVFLVELVGLIGASLAGVRAITGSRKVATPYSLTVTQAALKAATGAATAVIGVLSLSAGIVPGLSQLQSQAAILAYAVVFGYAQQLLTGVIDQRANDILQAASPATKARPTEASGDDAPDR